MSDGGRAQPHDKKWSLPAKEAAEGVANLIGKSLVTADYAGAVANFRLLETMCAYGLEKLTDAGEVQPLAWRHAEYYQRPLEENADDRDANRRILRTSTMHARFWNGALIPTGIPKFASDRQPPRRRRPAPPLQTNGTRSGLQPVLCYDTKTATPWR